jgi:hypothetical protein
VVAVEGVGDVSFFSMAIESYHFFFAWVLFFARGMVVTGGGT